MLIMQGPRFLLLLLCSVSSLHFFAQDSGDDLIRWSSSRRLTWSDYQASPDPLSDAAATTTSYLGIQYNFIDDKVTYKIECSFSRNRSWGLYKTDYILSHEQGHFDITEIFARQLNKRMGDYMFNKNSYRKDLQKIYNDVQKEKEIFQNQYDNETDYSRKKDKQAEWLTKIDKLLGSLDEFANYH